MKYPPMPDLQIEKELREFIRSLKPEGLSRVFDEKNNWKRFEEVLGKDRVAEIFKEEGIDVTEILSNFLNKTKEYFSGLAELAASLSDAQGELDELLKPSNAQAVGELLLAHLKLEYIMDKIINDNFKMNSEKDMVGKARLSFVQKLNLLPSNSQLTKVVIELLSEINRLRNAYAHNIKFDIQNFKSKIFDEALSAEKIATGDEKFQGVMKLIQMCEIILLLQTPSFKGQMEKIMEKYPILKNVAFQSSDGNSATVYDFLSGL